MGVLDFCDVFLIYFPVGAGGSLTAMVGDTITTPRQGWLCGAKGSIHQNGAL